MRPILLAFVISFGLCACSTRIEHIPQTDAPQPGAINVNTATAGELERLPHIGHKTAAAIVNFRVKNGYFRRVEDLLLIRGISEARFAELRPLLKVD